MSSEDKRIEFESTSDNHIVVDVNSNKLFIDFVSFNSFNRKVLSLAGCVELFLYFNDTPTHTDIKNIKSILRIMSANQNIKVLNVNIISFDYENSYDCVYEILYSDPVQYNKNNASKFILRCMIMKLLGLNGIRKVSKVILTLSRLKKKIIRN